MRKGKHEHLPVHELPIAPWIYINDPTDDGEYAYQLAAMMPKDERVHLTQELTKTSALFPLITRREYRDKVVIVTSNPLFVDAATSFDNAQVLQQAAIEHGCNFASINVVDADAKDGLDVKGKSQTWGTNHLDLTICSAHDPSTIKATVERIYKWLFSAFAVLETLHLIPDEQMTRPEGISAYKDAEYCPLNEANSRPRDQKIQFIAVVLSKPEVQPNNRVRWKVADKTGTFTWDWVLSLKPGDLKCLPRRPGVLIKERPFVTVLKSPFRVTGAAMVGAGNMVQKVGRGVVGAGKKVSLGKSAEWVSQSDVSIDAKGRRFKKPKKNSGFIHYEPSVDKCSISIFTEKGEKAWEDDDTIASTSAKTLVNEKAVN